MKLFPNAIKVTSPSVIVKSVAANSTLNYSTDVKRGKFYLVQPTTAKEVFFLQMLEHNVQKFTPAVGHGVLITVDVFQNLQK